MTNELAHLHPTYRPYAALPANERIQWTRHDRWISYDRVRIQAPAFMTPQAADRRDGERARVVVRPDIHKARVASDVIDAIGVGPWHVGGRKIMRTYPPRLFRGTPLLAGIVEVADELLLLRIHGDHRAAVPEAAFHRGVDVPKLRIPVRMVPPLFRVPVALEVVVEPPQELRHLRMADPMVSPPQGRGDGPRALTNPPQGRFRIAARLGIDHRFQGVHEARVRHRDGRASGAGAPDPAGHHRGPLFNLTDALGNRVPSKTAGSMDETHATIAQRHRFTRRHKAPRALVQQRPHRLELGGQFSKTAHPRAA